MYIEYITPQRVADPKVSQYDSKGGDYRPTWLIRTFDWQKVPGTDATDGYHTLSYVWEQSGEKVLQADGEYGLTDDGHHRVTKITTNKRLRTCSSKYQRRPELPVTQKVTYDKLLQQICWDFDIKYLWYDKVCIDQTNKEEKKREIKQMHLIYSNARYTLALVPEVNVDNTEERDRIRWDSGNTEAKDKALQQMEKSLWWKRSWTLEEVMMSTRILIVGRNTHFWSLANFKQDEIKEVDILADTMLGFKERKMKSANQVLYYAHLRTSTKQHDKIYALANIFADKIPIDINYASDVSTAMNDFYRNLAENDLSVMCFGTNLFPTNLFPSGVPILTTTMDSYKLPSWTGVTGLHSYKPIFDTTLDQNYDYTIDDNMQLHIKCRFYTIRPTKYNDYGVYGDEERAKRASKNYLKIITSMSDFDGDESEALDWSQYCMPRATNCFPTHYHAPENHIPFLSPILPLSLTEECDECVILGAVFDIVMAVAVNKVIVGYNHNYLSPVAKKSTDGSSYRIIGLILLKQFQHDESRKSPQEVMDKMFAGLGCKIHNSFHIN